MAWGGIVYFNNILLRVITVGYVWGLCEFSINKYKFKLFL